MIKEYGLLRPMSGIEERGKEIVFMTIKTNSKKDKREGKRKWHFGSNRS